MKSKTAWLYLALALALGAAAFVFWQRRSDDIGLQADSIRLPDTTRIHRVVLRQPSLDRELELRRSAGGWELNQNLQAQNGAIQVFFRIMANLSLKAPVPESEREAVRASFESERLEVEIFDQRDRAIRNFWVGKTNAQKSATYMTLPENEQPLLFYVPGFANDLRTNFSPDEYLWRDNTLLNYLPDQILSISLQHWPDSAASFRVDWSGDAFQLTDHLGQRPANPDTEALRRYLTYFTTIGYAAKAELASHQKDSLDKARPNFVLEVRNRHGLSNQLEGHLIAQPDGSTNFDQVWVRFNDEAEYLVVKFAEIDPVLKRLDYFVLGQP